MILLRKTNSDKRKYPESDSSSTLDSYRKHNSELRRFDLNIAKKIKSTPLFRQNSRPVDWILILLFVSFFVVGADLTKEMAKGEFVFFACILTETQTIDTFSIYDALKFDPPVIGVVSVLRFIPPKSDVSEIYLGRAPPLSPSHI